MAQELATTKNKNLVYSMRDKFIEITKNETLFEREAGFAIQTLNNNSYLAGCDPNSILTAVYNIALTGLTLNPVLKLAYLIPRKGKCILDISYVGMVKILTDYGIIRNVEADIICANDKYKIEKGAKPILKHIPNYLNDRGNPIVAYAVAFFQQGGSQFEIMSWKEVMGIKGRSESVKAGKGSPWDSDEFEMAKKTLIRRIYKYLPKSNVPEGVLLAVAKAIDIDTENNSIDFEGEKKASKQSMNEDLFATPPPVIVIEEAQVVPPVQQEAKPAQPIPVKEAKPTPVYPKGGPDHTSGPPLKMQ